MATVVRTQLTVLNLVFEVLEYTKYIPVIDVP
jgi:hypothetical protein